MGVALSIWRLKVPTRSPEGNFILMIYTFTPDTYKQRVPISGTGLQLLVTGLHYFPDTDCRYLPQEKDL